METTAENPLPPEINGPDSPTDPINGSDSPTSPEVCNHDHLLAELDSLRQAYQSLQSKSATSEENLLLLFQQEKDELSRERDALRDKIAQGEEYEKKCFEFVKSSKDNLANIIECLDDEGVIQRGSSGMVGSKLGQESRALCEEETAALPLLASKAEAKVREFKEAKKKEKKELENSVVSLTEENRDINTLLRIALVEKEAVEKSLNKLKGNGEQQRRVPLLQFAERGLQRVGFGFMKGSGSNEQLPEAFGANVASTASNKSDSSECEEEAVSLVCILSYNLH